MIAARGWGVPPRRPVGAPRRSTFELVVPVVPCAPSSSSFGSTASSSSCPPSGRRVHPVVAHTSVDSSSLLTAAALACGAFSGVALARKRRRGGVLRPRTVLRGSEGVEISDSLGKELKGNAIIVGWDPGPQDRKPGEPPWSAEESLEELMVLCESIDLKVKDRVLQKWRPDLGRLPLGKGKIEELQMQVKKDPDIGVVVFDKDLTVKDLLILKGRISPEGDCVILDRTSLILRIFAARARTKEAKLQVTLASQQYMMPRLRYYLTEGGGLEARGGSAAGSSQSGSAGAALRGKGETQLAMDQARLREQMAKVRKKIYQVSRHRKETRRRTKAVGIPIIALVGYTNAGKSTLLNRLCNASEVVAEDRLFETLDPTRRQVKLSSGREAFAIDTVGFIQRLPEQLVAGFRATLEELSEADVVLHVIDISSPTMYQQVGTVQKTLRKLRSYDIKTPQLLVFNKVDKLEDGVPPELQQSLEFPWKGVVGHVQISARNGDGMDLLAEAVENTLTEHTRFGAERLQLLIPYTESSQYAKLRGPPPMAKIDKEEHTPEGYLVDIVASPDAARQLRKWEVPGSAESRMSPEITSDTDDIEEDDFELEDEGDDDGEYDDFDEEEFYEDEEDLGDASGELEAASASAARR